MGRRSGSSAGERRRSTIYDVAKEAGQKEGEKDQLFLVAKIMRFIKKGEKVSWVADNLEAEPAFVEAICQILAAQPGADAHQVLARLVGR